MVALVLVFMPPSLAALIFSMNVQQMNKNGPDIRMFLITASSILTFSVRSWSALSLLKRI